MGYRALNVMDVYAAYATFGIAMPLVLWFVCTHWKELNGLSLLGARKKALA
ncbi:hypothetical protein NTE_01275 [Candidatus Nitrososphaera evergladensis SR1]|jgi:hypothetical protein|uniref:Uncharacterized protein n=1 Tax=Candidatus Nitrososphaera evergladensis SR1 TaxID=1459636 RepID=A0A075MVM6_9ARCH|nr:hypothetical protein [Candidatus Nitrososphaera evergladensis]AIF83344.1 hypothetical protein NTE_01275 [Candidatus Nitrososphaera evergladensis SR1]